MNHSPLISDNSDDSDDELDQVFTTDSGISRRQSSNPRSQRVTFDSQGKFSRSNNSSLRQYESQDTMDNPSFFNGESHTSEYDDYQQSTESGSESFRNDSYLSQYDNTEEPYGMVAGGVEYHEPKTQFQMDLEDHLRIERKAHLMRIHQTFVGLWRTGTLCDIILKTHDTLIPVHSAVVVGHSGRCEKETMDFQKSKTFPIVIVLSAEIQLKALQQVVEFMYLAKLELELDNLVPIQKAAKELEVYVISARCGKILERLLEDQNIIQTIQAATELGADDLQEAAWSKFTKDFKLFYQREAFLEQSLQAVTKVLSSDFLVPKSEFEVFEAAMAWINHRRHERLKHLPRLLECVRLIHLSDEELINCMQYDEVFAVSPGLEILAQANMNKMLKDRGELSSESRGQKLRTRQPAQTAESRYGAFRNSMMVPQSQVQNDTLNGNGYARNYGAQTNSAVRGGPVLMAAQAERNARQARGRGDTEPQHTRHRPQVTREDWLSEY